MRAILFHNPKAEKNGHGKADILAALQLADHTAKYVSSKSKSFKGALEKIDADFVVVAGGDGTVGKVLRNVASRKLPVGILPLGTANNIARSLGIAGTPQIVVEQWQMGRTRPLDIGLAEGPWGVASFMESFGVGIVAEMIASADKKEKEEGARNLQVGREMLRKTIKKAAPLDIEVMIDGKRLEGQWLGVEVLNIPYTGPGLALAPKADHSDGMLDVVCFPVEKRDELCQWVEAPAEASPPALWRRGRMITLTWRNAAHRIDDATFARKVKPQTTTICCDSEPAKVLEALPPGHHVAKTPKPMEAAQ
jgi:diacylglycerol kinase family enzyme